MTDIAGLRRLREERFFGDWDEFLEAERALSGTG